VSARYAGTYQWTVGFDVRDDWEKMSVPPGSLFEHKLRLKFGPSAWLANEKDPKWERTVDPGVANYSRLFHTRWAKVKEVRQSDVSVQQVLDGLASRDLRLHNEILQLLRDSD